MNKVTRNKTKEELITELKLLHQRVAELEESGSKNKHEHEELKETCSRLKSIFSSLADLVFVFDKEARFTSFFIPGEQLYVNPEKFIRKKLSEVMPPHVNELFNKAFNKNKEGEIAEYEYWLNVDSKIKWYSAKLSPIVQNGDFSGSVAVIRNITERKRMEDELKELKSYYQAIFNTALLGIGIATYEGRILAQNNAMVQMTGYSEEEIGKINLADTYWNPEDRALVLKKLQIEGFVKNFEVALKHKDGTPYYAKLNITPFRLDGDEVLLTVAEDVTERNRMESQLRNTTAEYLATINMTGDIILRVDRDNRRILVNDGACKFFGSSKEKLLNDTFDICFYPHPDDKPEALQAVDKMMKTGKPIIGLINRQITPHGTRIVEWNTHPFFDDNGQFNGWQATGRDITDRKKMEEELRESEEKLRLMFESVAEGITVIDLEGNISQLNEATARLHGYDNKEEMIGLSTFEFIAKKDHARAMQNLKRTLKKGYSGTIGYTLLRKDGSEFAGELNAATLKDALGKPIGFIAITRDITSRKQAEEKIINAYEELNQIFETAADGMCLIDKEFNMVRINKRFSNLSGTNPDEVRGKKCYEVFNDPRCHTKNCSLQRILGGEDYIECEANKKLYDGVTIPCIVTATPYYRHDGELIGIVEDIKDITELKKMMEQLKQYSDHLEELVEERTTELQEQIRRRIEFTRALVHELKTPLTAIMSSSEVLTTELQDDLWLQLARNIYRGACNLNRRIDELLDLARSEIGTLRAKRKSVNTLGLLYEVAEEMTALVTRKGQSLVLEVPEWLSPIWAEKDRIKQVLHNLISNALKFNRRSGRITLKASEKDGYIIFEVQDEGQGITNRERKRIFQPYYRLESDRQRFSGLGLGLALSKSLVELHQGQIWVKSQRGKGSTFGFSIPLAVARPERVSEDE